VTGGSASGVNISGYQLIIGSKNYSSWLTLQTRAPFEKTVILFHTGNRNGLMRELSPFGFVLAAAGGCVFNQQFDHDHRVFYRTNLYIKLKAAGGHGASRCARGSGRNAFRLWGTAVGLADEFSLGARKPQAKR
jgi:hypothetical protein